MVHTTATNKQQLCVLQRFSQPVTGVHLLASTEYVFLLQLLPRLGQAGNWGLLPRLLAVQAMPCCPFLLQHKKTTCLQGNCWG